MAFSSRIFQIFLVCLLATSFSCEKEQIIVPKEGYDWPDKSRDYWPSLGWKVDSMENHSIDPGKMKIADEFAANDHLSEALLVIKDGFIVFEKYYHDGGRYQSTNLWSITKSYSSSIVGLVYDDQVINSTDQLMKDLLPQFPDFEEISLKHVLTQTTGLSWAESGPLWVDWIKSEDWVTAALGRGFNHKPGTQFYYSSGNSHFLNSMVYYLTGMTPGHIAKQRLFNPMGVHFTELDQPTDNTMWDNYLVPLAQSWHKDPKGIETASFGLFMTARDMAKFGFLYLNRGRWNDDQLLSEEWIIESVTDHETDIYDRYSYGYQWWITMVGGHPAFLASGYGGQIIGVVPGLDLVVVLKYNSVNPQHPQSGTNHDDMHLFELVVNAIEH